MLKRLYRIVSWICIVAHLNLVMLPHHQASAMDCDREASTESSHHPVSEQHFIANEEEQYSLTAGCIRDIKEPSEEGSSFWTYANKLKNTATNARKWLTGAIENNLTECISLAGCAVTSYLGVEPAASFFYWGAFVVGNHIMDQLRSSQDPYQKTRTAIKTVTPWIKSLAPFVLLSMTHAAPLVINGGYERSLVWPRAKAPYLAPERFYYGDAAPYPINLTGNQSIAVFLRLTDGIEAFYARHPGEYGYTHYQIPGSELTFDSATNMLKIVTNQAVDFLSHLSFEPPADIKCKDGPFGPSCTRYVYSYPFGGTIEMVFQLTTNLTARFNDPDMTLVKHRLHIPHDPTSFNFLIGGCTAAGVVIMGLAGWGGIAYAWAQYNHYSQETAWDNIQKDAKSLNNVDLFNLCNTIKKEHPSYAEVIKKQADCLHQMLTSDSNDKDILLQKLFQAEDTARRLDIASQYIQTYKEPLGMDLFDLCNYIKKENFSYNEALEIQADCLHQVLTNDPINKNIILQKLSQAEDTARRQAIAWQCIQKHKEEMKEKEPRILFNLCSLIDDRQTNASDDEETLVEVVVQVPETTSTHENPVENDSKVEEELKEILILDPDTAMTQENQEENTLESKEDLSENVVKLKEILGQEPETTTICAQHQVSEKKESKKVAKLSRYEASLSLQVECLREILDKEPGTERSSELFLILMNKELENIATNRRQEFMLRLISKSDIQPEIKINLCDQIQKGHIQYVRTMIEKAHLIIGDKGISEKEGQSPGEQRFKQAMLALIECQDDKDAKAFRETLRADYWTLEVGGILPKALKEPQNEEELNDFMSFAKEQKKQMQSAATSL